MEEPKRQPRMTAMHVRDGRERKTQRQTEVVSCSENRASLKEIWKPQAEIKRKKVELDLRHTG